MSTYKTFPWLAGAKRPQNYADLIQSTAARRVVTLDEIHAFVKGHPEVENSSNQSQLYVKKLFDGYNENKPAYLSFWSWVRHIYTRVGDTLEYHPDGRIVFRYDYDYYSLVDACRIWMKWREKEWVKHHSTLGALDHGWWSHGLRLIARLQWWTLTGTDNWSNPNYDPSRSRRIAKKRVLEKSTTTPEQRPRPTMNTEPITSLKVLPLMRDDSDDSDGDNEYEDNRKHELESTNFPDTTIVATTRTSTSPLHLPIPPPPQLSQIATIQTTENSALHSLPSSTPPHSPFSPPLSPTNSEPFISPFNYGLEDTFDMDALATLAAPITLQHFQNASIPPIPLIPNAPTPSPPRPSRNRGIHINSNVSSNPRRTHQASTTPCTSQSTHWEFFDTTEAIIGSLDGMRAVRRQVDKFQDRLRLEEQENGVNLYVNVPSVPIIDVVPFTNYKIPMTTSRLLLEIDRLFATMSREQYDRWDYKGLEAYYEPKPNGRKGYKPIYVNTKAWGWQRLGSIDHIIPQSYGVFDHPRFYIMCHCRLNAHMGDKHPEYRIAAGLTRAQFVKIKDLVRRFRKMSAFRDVWKTFCSQLEDVKPIHSM